MRKTGRARQRGMALFDVLMGSSVLSIAILGTIASIPAVHRLEEGLKEREQAHFALLTVCDQVMSMGGVEAFREFNSSPEDDPDGPGTAIGPRFAVGDLVATAPDGAVGHVRFPIYKVVNDRATFSENQSDPTVSLGMPRDLDGDGKLKSSVTLDELRVIPVQVTIDWSGAGGEQHLEAVLMLAP